MSYIWSKKEWPNFTWQADALINSLSQARSLQGQLLSKVRALGMDLGKESQSEIMIEEAIKTSAIEGVKLDKEAVRSSVARRLGLSTAGLKEPDRNTEGLIDVIIDATTNYKKSLTTNRLKSWQAALFPTGYSGLTKIRTGRWRGKLLMQVVSGPVGKEKIHFEAPPTSRLDKEMKRFLKWWNNKSKKTDGLLRAGVAHLYFVTIHPFEDGNGRVARALLEMALAQDENMSKRYYSLSSRIMKERKSYYEKLEDSQKGSTDITKWLLWFLYCYSRAIKDSERILSSTLKKAEFWNKHMQTELNKNQRKVINRLLDAGPGGFIGGLSTRKYVSTTRVSRATAYRDINDLLKKGILKQRDAKGRSIAYDLLFP